MALRKHVPYTYESDGGRGTHSKEKSDKRTIVLSHDLPPMQGRKNKKKKTGTTDGAAFADFFVLSTITSLRGRSETQYHPKKRLRHLQCDRALFFVEKGSHANVGARGRSTLPYPTLKFYCVIFFT